jgi:putative Holliday junction resolvase
VGAKRIGVALSDPLKKTAQPFGVIERKDLTSVAAQVKGMIDKFDVDKIIIGLPVKMDGTLGLQGQAVKNFAGELRSLLMVSVETWDERLTTKEARRLLREAEVAVKKRRGVTDKVAAALILQSYLNSQK